MTRFIRLAAVMMALLLAGCSHTTNRDDARPQAWLQPGTTPAIRAQQLLTGSFKGQTQSLLVMLNADGNKVALAGLSSVGIRLFLATYDDTGIHTEQSVVMPQLPPASQVLADVMLSHWPLSAWQPQLPKGWTLNDTDTRRELRNPDGKLVTEIVYLNRNGRREPISIVQHAFHYHITIQYLGD